MGRRVAVPLTDQQVRRLREPGLYAVGGLGCDGLGLSVTTPTARSWVLRATVGGKRRHYGLGSYPLVTLLEAREKARALRKQISEGGDPIAEREAAVVRAAAARAMEQTFRTVAERYMDQKAAGWTAKHLADWRASLKTHAYPKLGEVLVRDIQLPHVLEVLEPIWTSTTETATRVRSRIELVLSAAAVHGLRGPENPARWRGNLDAVLPKPSKVTPTEHLAALPAGELPGFMARLRAMQGQGARALEFTILTAARSGEVRGATWAEIDLEARMWVVPGARMKAKQEHRVPLSAPALALLEAIEVREGLVFRAPRGGMLSDMTLSAVLRRLEVPVTVHGFRSTFRDWMAERTSYPNEMGELALAHRVGDKVEAAYRRGDMFERRRRLMQDWARFCATEPGATGDVVPIRGQQALDA